MAWKGVINEQQQRKTKKKWAKENVSINLSDALELICAFNIFTPQGTHNLHSDNTL